MNFARDLKEDCVGLYRIYTYRMDRNLSGKDLSHLEKLGEVRVFRSFPVPYFRCQGKGFLIKGVMGTPLVEVTFYDLEQCVSFEQVLEEI